MKTGSFSNFSRAAGSFFKKKEVRFIVSGLLGVLVFFLIFGADSLSIFDNRLFSRGDPGAHYIGWRFFRDSDWQLHFGLMNRIDHPYSVSIIFTDSIPLAAVIFKLFRNVLPEEFNYLGLWTLLSFFLQGAAAAMILGVFADRKEEPDNDHRDKESGGTDHDRDDDDRESPDFCNILTFIGAVFFVLTPAFVARAFWHTALTSHFLILFSMYLFFGREEIGKKHSKPVRLFFWAVMGLLCGSVHLYFLGICGLIAVIDSCDEWMRSDTGLISFLTPVSFGLSGLLTIWFLGAFDSGMGSGAPGFGYYSFNLNGFFNSRNWSDIFNFPYYQGDQIEGFAYLGFGMMALILLSAGIGIRRFLKIRQERNEDSSVFPAAAVLFLISVVIAVSNIITFSDKLILAIDLGDAGFIRRLTDIFRSSGRFSWVAMYLLMIGGMAGVMVFIRELSVRKEGLSAGIMTALVFSLLILQITDIFPGLKNKSGEVRGTVEADSVLDDEYWDELAESGRFKHIVFLNKEYLLEEDLYSLAFYAIDNDMTINNFNFARAFDLNVNEIASDSASHPDPDKIYILTEEIQEDAARYPELDFQIADGIMVGVMKD